MHCGLGRMEWAHVKRRITSISHLSYSIQFQAARTFATHSEMHMWNTVKEDKRRPASFVGMSTIHNFLLFFLFLFMGSLYSEQIVIVFFRVLHTLLYDVHYASIHVGYNTHNDITQCFAYCLFEYLLLFCFSSSWLFAAGSSRTPALCLTHNTTAIVDK